MNTYLLLMLEFAKTGLFAIGGGLATLPFLRDMTMRYPWFTMEDLLDMIAISESTPGPIGINMATFAGFNHFVLGVSLHHRGSDHRFFYGSVPRVCCHPTGLLSVEGRYCRFNCRGHL